jgi:hypothetical protein
MAGFASCPIIDQSKFELEFKTSFDLFVTNEEKNQMLVDNMSCPVVGGGSNEMRGGDIKSIKRYIKICLYVIIAATSAYLVSSVDKTIKEAVIVGLTQVFKGQCGTPTNLFWGWLGLNPVCGMYNKIFTIITRAMAGDAASWATIIGAVTATGTTGRLTITNIDNLAVAIADVIVPGGNLIEDEDVAVAKLEGKSPEIATKSDNILAITNGSSGGKRSKTNKRKHNKAKKSKKSRKSARKSKSRK